MDEPIADLELRPNEYVCETCHLVHHAPAGPSWCDLQ